MKLLVFIALLINVLIIGGCTVEGTKDGNITTASSFETVTNPLFIGTKTAEESFTEIIVELTELIEETHTHSKVEQTAQNTKPTISEKNSDIIGIINNYRISKGLKLLKTSELLCNIAKIRAEESSICWSHTRPNGQKIDSLLSGSNIHWTILGENLARHKNAPAEAIVNAWMNSKSHRENLLNSRYKYCGITEYQNDEICYIALILTD